MEEVKIKAILREERGTSKSRALRREKFVPAVAYGKDANYVIKIERKELKYLRQHHFSENVIINLEISNHKKSEVITVLLKDYQLNPVTEEIIHLDFIKVSMKEKIAVEVPIEIKGEAAGVKSGGSLERVLWNIKVECLPKDIPESIVVDVSNLNIGDSIHVEDLSQIEGVEFLTEPKEVVVNVAAPVKEEEIVEAAEEAAEEPEVIKEKPKEEEKEEGAKEEKPKEKQKDKEK